MSTAQTSNIKDGENYHKMYKNHQQKQNLAFQKLFVKELNVFLL